MAVAVIFPGQGTQGPNMGAPWRDHVAWSVVERAEAALGEPLAPLLLAGSAEALARTRESQLSVLLTSLVVWEAARAHVPHPVAFAGHSLGQVTALIAAGAVTLEDGVILAARRAELTQAAADLHGGKMAALMGADEAQATAVAAAAGGDCWLANDNAPGQMVIAGTPDGIERGTKAAADLGIRRVIPLPVGGAFHTPLMADAAEGMVPVLAATAFADTATAVVSNTDARPHRDGTGWRTRLAAHLVNPVRWRPSMTTLVEEMGVTGLVEVGFGSTLAGLARRCVPGTPVRNLATPQDLVSLSEVPL